jgi:hypothetical protein
LKSHLGDQKIRSSGSEICYCIVESLRRKWGENSLEK